MGEKPFVGLSEIEDTCQAPMVLPFQAVIDQSGGVATRAHGVDHTVGATHRRQIVGRAMDNPQGQGAQAAEVVVRQPAAHGHGGGYLVGISRCHVQGAPTTHTHTEHIEAVGVHFVMVVDPIV